MTLAHDDHAVGQAEQLRHIGGDHDDGLSFLCQLRHELVNFALRTDVDAARRLVEDQHVAVAQDPFGNDDLLLVAAGEAADAGADRRRFRADLFGVLLRKPLRLFVMNKRALEDLLQARQNGHISKNMLEAADTVVNGVPFACDVGVFNQDYFVYIAAFGLFTDVSYETKQSMKNVLGHLAYILEGTKRIFNIPSYRIKVTHDGETIEDEFIYGMVTNSRSVGGFKGITGKNVVFDDGKFEVTLFKTPRNPMELNEILGALALRKINPKRMYSFKTNEVHFETEEEIPWTLDGEFGGVHEEVVVKDCQKALEIMVKPEVIEDVSEKKGTE